MRVLVSGSSGLIGSALVRRLERAQNEVGRLVRSSTAPGELAVRWNPSHQQAKDRLAGNPDPGGELDWRQLSSFDAVVHLAGRNLAGRWSVRMKREIRDSRLLGTAIVARAVASSFRACGRPSVMVSASAIGYYGDRGDELLIESSPGGAGFLAELCRDWEAATAPAAEAGVRVVSPRIGVVLSSRGGALMRLLPLFRLGLGGQIGSGDQYWSWIALEDVVAAIEFALDSNLSGPANLTSPNPATNAEFTAALARALHRPAVLPVPAFALRFAVGEMADEALLASQRVRPAKLLEAGFRFAHPQLDDALAAVLRGSF